MPEIPIIDTKGFFVKIVWFHETNGVTLHIGTSNSILTKNGVIAFWNCELFICEITQMSSVFKNSEPVILTCNQKKNKSGMCKQTWEKVYLKSQILVPEYWTILDHFCIPVL